LVHHTGDHVEGARLAAAAARVYAQLGGQLNPVDNRQLEAVLQLSAESLGESQPAAIRERFAGEAIEAVIIGALRLLSTAEGSPRRDEPIGIGR
jgi:hypothetical protein